MLQLGSKGSFARTYFTKEKTVFYLFFLGIFSFSFYLYSPYTSIRFSSDHAVHVLMAYDFKFPDNLYYWGQNRLGSFVPMLAHLLCSIGASPLLAVSLVHWTLLFFTSLLVCRLFSSIFIKVLFLILWLLPLYPFKEHLALAHPYAPQFFFIFLGIFLIEKFTSGHRKKYAWLITGMIVLFMSCWISELSAAFIAIFFVCKFAWAKRYSAHHRIFSSKKEGITVAAISLGAIVLTACFIAYAKSRAVRIEEYASLLADPKEWTKGIIQHLSDLAMILSHPIQDPLKWLYALLFFPTMVAAAVFFLKNRHKISRDKMFLICLLSTCAIIIWLSLYTLAWTHMNAFDYRHWTFPYLFVILTLLLIADLAPFRIDLYKVLLTLLAAAQIPISYVYATDKTVMRNDIDFSYSEFKEFRQLGKCGLIGNYWFTYVVAAADPSSIVATPRETEYARGQHLIPLVFQQPKIYLAKNSWFDNWPWLVKQYNRYLFKNGKPFQIERVEFCEYKLYGSGIELSLGPDDLGQDPGSIDVAGGTRVNPCHDLMDGYAIMGPFFELPPGNYKGRFSFDSLAIDPGDTLTIDIVSNWGALCMFRKTLTAQNAPGNSSNIPFEFKLDAMAGNIEARIYVKGRSSLLFREVSILQIE